MYHDQGLPTLKHAGFGHAVNVTLGLPVLRTSVDHGTALDLAGTGRADVGSLGSGGRTRGRSRATSRSLITIVVFARKRFGQHFLHDAGVIAQIVEAIDPQADDAVIEIGPGHGVLTRPLLDAVVAAAAALARAARSMAARNRSRSRGRVGARRSSHAAWCYT
jgi:hypothetical protein